MWDILGSSMLKDNRTITVNVEIISATYWQAMQTQQVEKYYKNKMLIDFQKWSFLLRKNKSSRLVFLPWHSCTFYLLPCSLKIFTGAENFI